MSKSHLAKMLLLVLALGACSRGEKFAGGNSLNGSTASEPEDTNQEGTIGGGDSLSTVFKVGGEKLGTDLLWVIDNSGSMAQEIRFVEQNFAKFLGAIKAATDTKVGFISCIDPLNPLCLNLTSLGVTASEVTILNQEVGSTNGLALTASSLCAPETTVISADPAATSATVCGEQALLPGSIFGGGRGGRGFNAPGVDAVKGKLADFFRANSRRIFVVVSDDGVQTFLGPQFEKVTDAKFGKGGYELFGFVGRPTSVPSATCTVAALSPDYETLATNTNGKLYDICAADWSKNFTEFSDGIVMGALRTYEIKEEGELIVLDVLHNGAKIDSKFYTVTGNKVVISNDYKLDVDDSIEVIYEVK
ncbi:MAG: hypothetical protein AB7T49_00185 [Oligoflexales bacterium]